MEIKSELNYPEHNHPHGVNNLDPNKFRTWVCDDCCHVFSDKEVREQSQEWGHPCKKHPCRKGQRCEGHLEPFMPELKD